MKIEDQKLENHMRTRLGKGEFKGNKIWEQEPQIKDWRVRTEVT